ncbi:MAG: hypothetical protein M1379_10800 [Firmicutes bacterium]|nr:hypothetical protein [Bacillota bacterium]
MAEDTGVTITIFGAREKSLCFSGGCGPGEDREEISRYFGRLTQKYYGDQVRVEYVDVAGPDVQRFAGLEQMAKDKLDPLPCVVISGQLKWPGNLTWPYLVAELAHLGIHPIVKRPRPRLPVIRSKGIT